MTQSAQKIDPVDLMEKNSIEPHYKLLKQAPEDQLLYKIVKVKNFLDMVEKNYLYFNRVDAYKDDASDGKQFPFDEAISSKIGFVKAPEFTMKDYYDKSRSHTYACCFSLENSDCIWENYSNNGTDAICLVFHFEKLRQMLNETISASKLKYGKSDCKQIFAINYGIVQYVDFNDHRLNTDKFSNPILYTYYKDKRYDKENELRVSLSALGMGDFVHGGSKIEFGESLLVEFDFKKAFTNQVITEIKHTDHLDITSLSKRLQELRFVPKT